MSDIALDELVVEVLHNRGSSIEPDWSLGSGCLVREGLVLTAARNVGLGELLIRWHGMHEHAATVCQRGDEDSFDLALLEVPRLRAQVPSLSYGAVDCRLGTAVKHCWTAGFPRFNEQQGHPTPLRLSARLNGEIPTAEQARLDVLTFRVTDSPRPLPRRTAETEWAGMSGAVVFAGEVLVGTVTEGRLPAEHGALAVVPITASQQRDDAALWWQLLGVDPTHLRCLPERSDGWSEGARPQSVRAIMHVLAELSSALKGLSRARTWTPARWMQDSTGLRTCLALLESSLATLPGECRPWPGSDDQAIQLGIACTEISEPLQNVRTSLDYLNRRELSDGERARELNIFTRSSRELQQAISHLHEILTALYQPGHPHQEKASQAPGSPEQDRLTHDQVQDASSPLKAQAGSTCAYSQDMTSAHAAGAPLSIDAVVMVALPVEEEAAVRALGNCSAHPWRGRRLHVGDVGGLRVLVFPIDGMGNVGSAEATTRVITTWNPAYIMLVGIAGGVRDAPDDIHLGDVLVPDQVVGYEPGKVRPDRIERRYEVYRPHPELLGAARGLVPQDWALKIVTPRPDRQSNRIIPQAHFGPMFVGEKVLADGATVAALRSAWPKAIGVEMEGLGVAVASYRSGLGFLAAKAVSDFADTSKNDDWQPYAAEAAARLAVAILKNAPLRPETERPKSQQVTDASLHAEKEVPKSQQVVAVTGFTGEIKVEFCRRIGEDWEELADLFGVPPYAKARFSPGNEPRDLWEWLEIRAKLSALPDKLREIERDDLAEIMLSPTP